MSNAAMNYVDDHASPEMGSGAFFVLFRLADHATDHSGEDWTCFPSVGRLQAKTHLSRATVERHLTNIYRKLGAAGRSDALVRAVGSGLVRLEG